MEGFTTNCILYQISFEKEIWAILAPQICLIDLRLVEALIADQKSYMK